MLDHAVDPPKAGKNEQFEALARTLRDLLIPRWLETQNAHNRANPKRVYYLYSFTARPVPDEQHRQHKEPMRSHEPPAFEG